MYTSIVWELGQPLDAGGCDGHNPEPPRRFGTDAGADEGNRSSQDYQGERSPTRCVDYVEASSGACTCGAPGWEAVADHARSQL